MKQTPTPTNSLAQTSSQPFFGRQAGGVLASEQGEATFFGSAPFIQAKLTIGAPDDPYEREADAVAEQVVQRMSVADNDPAGTADERMRKDKMIQEKPLAIQRLPVSVQRKCAACEEEEKVQKKEEDKPEELQGGIQRKPIFESNGDEEPPPGVQPAAPMVQRKCAACEKEESETLQRKPSGGGEMTASADVASRISHSKGGGSPLPESIQHSMGGALSADLSGVRVHTDSRAVQLNRDLGAQAFTHGSDVYFGAGKFRPGTGDGDRLLAHELVHVGQQTSNKLAKQTSTPSVQKQDETLDERADREANSGSSELRVALNQSLRTAMPFNFHREFDGTSRISVRAGGGVQVFVNTHFVDPTVVPSISSRHFTIRLMKDVDYWPDTEMALVRFSVGTRGQYTWDNLSAGDYYFHFAKTSAEEIAGTIWVEALSGSGEMADPSAREDQFEQDTGIVPERVAIGGTAYGEFVLRSEPVRNSFIFGTLPGTPIEIRVLDKRSFERAGGDSWYKIAFADSDAFRLLATEVPTELGSVARQMYDAENAWVTEDALKVYIPYEQLLTQVRAFESQADVSALSLGERITMLRQLYADPNLRSDEVLETNPGSRMAADRPQLSNLLQMLNGPATGVVLPNGERVDFGHFILTLDAYQRPDRAGTISPGFGLSPFQIGSTRAVSSWSGDVGAAAADYTIEHQDRGKGTALDSDLLDQHFEKSATDGDLLGNLDGLGASLLVNSGSVTSIEQLVKQYYEGITTAEPEGDPDARRNNRARALQSFLGSYGFTNPANLLSDRGAVNCLLVDSAIFALVWYWRGRGFSWNSLNPPITLLRTANAEMVLRFIRKLTSFVRDFGVTTIPQGTALAATCHGAGAQIGTGSSDAEGSRPDSIPSDGGVATPDSRKAIPLSPLQLKAENSSLSKKSAATIDHILSRPPSIQLQQSARTQLRSVIFRRSAAIMRAYARGTVDIGPTSGSRESIVMIQQALIYLGHDIGTPTGTYNQATSDAINTFQRDEMGLDTPSGTIDSATLGALDGLVASTESASPNSSSLALGGSRPTRFSDYPQTYISNIIVNLSAQTVVLTWSGPGGSARDTGPFDCSPGLGMLNNGTCFNCDDTTVSNTPGTNCTPKGTDHVDSVADSLSSYPEAMFVTFFVQSRGVAFHYYPSVPDVPASHGCVRLHLYPAILIHDNVIPGTTQTEVTGSWSRGWWDEARCQANSLRRGLESAGDRVWDYFFGDNED